MTTPVRELEKSTPIRDQRWRLTDLIDFEFLVAEDANAPDRADSYQRFRTTVLPELRETGADSRANIFRAWLEMERAAAKRTLPGEHLASAWQALVVLSILAGLGLGGSITAALLFYRGELPVNVSWFLACTVGVQMVILILAVILWLLRSATNLFDDFRPLRSLIAGLVWMLSTGLRHLPGEQRERLRAILAMITRRREIYGSLAAWPVLVITQVFAVSFNIGILATLLAHLAFTDIDFGWQSSFVRSPEAAYEFVAAMAMPWSWFAPNPHPTLPEVIESRFEYKEGIRPLSTAALKSWWPFLCYSVTFYGLLFRGGLLGFAYIRLRGSLRGLTFNHEGCNTLLRHLKGPLVQTQSGTAHLEIPAGGTTSIPHVAGGSSVALIASDLAESDAGTLYKRVTEYVRKQYGWDLVQMHEVQIDHPSGNLEALNALGNVADRLSSVLVVLPAKRAPIKAIALFVQSVAEASGSSPEIILLLVGRKEDGGFRTVDEETFTHWKNFVAIHGLRTSLEKWTPE